MHAKSSDMFLHAVSHRSMRKGDEPPPARIYYGLPRTVSEPLSSLLYFFSPSPSAAPALFAVLYMLYVWVCRGGHVRVPVYAGQGLKLLPGVV